VVDDAIAEAGKGARRARGKLPPHVMVYFVMALAIVLWGHQGQCCSSGESLPYWI
jgi:hypothetical protein